MLDLREYDDFYIRCRVKRAAGWEETGQIAKKEGNKYYAFYTVKEIERLESEGWMYVDCGCVNGGKKVQQKSYDMLVEILKAYGLNIEWDGRAGYRIKVTGLK